MLLLKANFPLTNVTNWVETVFPWTHDNTHITVTSKPKSGWTKGLLFPSSCIEKKQNCMTLVMFLVNDIVPPTGCLCYNNHSFRFLERQDVLQIVRIFFSIFESFQKSCDKITLMNTQNKSYKCKSCGFTSMKWLLQFCFALLQIRIYSWKLKNQVLNNNCN